MEERPFQKIVKCYANKIIGLNQEYDFLKENGYPEFVKPDVHIKAIFNGIGISDSNNDIQVFHDVIGFSKKIDLLPYKVDKMFWLVGSGKYYDGDEIQIQTDRDEFIESINKRLRLS